MRLKKVGNISLGLSAMLCFNGSIDLSCKNFILNTEVRFNCVLTLFINLSGTF